MDNPLFLQLADELRGMTEVVGGKRYAFEYANVGAREKIGKCKHSCGQSIVLCMDDEEEMVGCIEACQGCGLILPPVRVVKGNNKKPLPLGKYRSVFQAFKKLLAQPAQPC